MLRKLGVLELSPELCGVIDSRTDLPAGAQETELRAAAVVACEAIVSAAAGAFNACELDYYLWTLGKEGDFRTVERHATKDTSFY